MKDDPSGVPNRVGVPTDTPRSLGGLAGTLRGYAQMGSASSGYAMCPAERTETWPARADGHRPSSA